VLPDTRMQRQSCFHSVENLAAIERTSTSSPVAYNNSSANSYYHHQAMHSPNVHENDYQPFFKFATPAVAMPRASHPVDGKGFIFPPQQQKQEANEYLNPGFSKLSSEQPVPNAPLQYTIIKPVASAPNSPSRAQQQQQYQNNNSIPPIVIHNQSPPHSPIHNYAGQQLLPSIHHLTRGTSPVPPSQSPTPMYNSVQQPQQLSTAIHPHLMRPIRTLNHHHNSSSPQSMKSAPFYDSGSSAASSPSDEEDDSMGDKLGYASGGNQKSGQWTHEEHTRFLEGLTKHGRNWKVIAKDYVKTRSRVQVASHAQTYFLKMQKQHQVSSRMPSYQEELALY